MIYSIGLRPALHKQNLCKASFYFYLAVTLLLSRGCALHLPTVASHMQDISAEPERQALDLGGVQSREAQPEQN